MMGIVVETGECIASDGRLGTTMGWHCVVQGMPPVYVFLRKEGMDGKNPQRALAGLAGALGCCGNQKEIQSF